MSTASTRSESLLLTRAKTLDRLFRQQITSGLRLRSLSMILHAIVIRWSTLGTLFGLLYDLT